MRGRFMRRPRVQGATGKPAGRAALRGGRRRMHVRRRRERPFVPGYENGSGGVTEWRVWATARNPTSFSRPYKRRCGSAGDEDGNSAGRALGPPNPPSRMPRSGAGSACRPRRPDVRGPRGPPRAIVAGDPARAAAKTVKKAGKPGRRSWPGGGPNGRHAIRRRPGRGPIMPTGRRVRADGAGARRRPRFIDLRINMGRVRTPRGVPLEFYTCMHGGPAAGRRGSRPELHGMLRAPGTPRPRIPPYRGRFQPAPECHNASRRIVSA